MRPADLAVCTVPTRRTTSISDGDTPGGTATGEPSGRTCGTTGHGTNPCSTGRHTRRHATPGRTRRTRRTDTRHHQSGDHPNDTAVTSGTNPFDPKPRTPCTPRHTTDDGQATTHTHQGNVSTPTHRPSRCEQHAGPDRPDTDITQRAHQRGCGRSPKSTRSRRRSDDAAARPRRSELASAAPKRREGSLRPKRSATQPCTTGRARSARPGRHDHHPRPTAPAPRHGKPQPDTRHGRPHQPHDTTHAATTTHRHPQHDTHTRHATHAPTTPADNDTPTPPRNNAPPHNRLTPSTNHANTTTHTTHLLHRPVGGAGGG